MELILRRLRSSVLHLCLIWIAVALSTYSFISCPDHIEPHIFLPTVPSRLAKLPSPFPEGEKSRELTVGKAFAKEGDYYRAITCFKEAKILCKDSTSLQEIEYGLFLSYYFAGKHEQATEVFEKSSLQYLEPQFPAYKQLIATLFDCYLAQKNEPKMQALLNMMRSIDQERADKLVLYKNLMQGLAPQDAQESSFIAAFNKEKKSPHRAQLLNALIPGAGYWYVGQTQSGITSFFLNALFLGTAYQFFTTGYYAAALVAGGFEIGWYGGGIKGSGLAAKQYNEALWASLAQELMVKTGACPVCMVEYGF